MPNLFPSCAAAWQRHSIAEIPRPRRFQANDGNAAHRARLRPAALGGQSTTRNVRFTRPGSRSKVDVPGLIRSMP